MPQLYRSSKGGKICFWMGQNFWVGLVFTKFSVDIQKKKRDRANMVYFSPMPRLVSKKKPPFWNCCKGNESLGGYVGQFGGGCLGGRRPLLPPLVAALTCVCKKII